MSQITELRAIMVLDNRGMPTIRAYAEIDGRFRASADVPRGSSTGSSEALDLRDGDKSRYRGQGVQKAIKNIHEIIRPCLMGMDASDQREVDNLLIELGGENKSNLGANATLGVSYAVAKAVAAAQGLALYEYMNPNAVLLPVPQVNIIGGGKHAGNALSMQEFFIEPVGAPTFTESVRWSSEITMAAKDLLEDLFGPGATNAGEDCGFAPPMTSSREAIRLLYDAVEKAGYTGEVVYGLDVASTHFYDRETGIYNLDGEQRDRDGMIAFFVGLVNEFPEMETIEDGLFEDDFEGTARLAEALPSVLIIGDDLFTTNPDRLKRGIREKAGNALLWKPNMIGTITEAVDVAHHAQENGFTVVVSERSGATEDTTLSDLCVAINSGMNKFGGLRGSAQGRYNRTLEIEDELGEKAIYAGRNFRIAA